MGCGGSRKEIKGINLPPERLLSNEKYIENKEKFLEKSQNFHLILNSDHEVYNLVEKLKKNQRKDDFKNELDQQVWEMFSAKYSNYTKGEVQDRILEMMSESFMIKNFNVQRIDIFEIVFKFIDKFEINSSEKQNLQSILNQEEFILKNDLGIYYDYNQLFINTNAFTFSHINSCLNYSSRFNTLSFIHINLEVTYPIDPINIYGIGELIENRDIEALSIIFSAKVGEVTRRKELIEFNINQYSMILFRAAKNSKSLKHFSIGFNFKRDMVHNKIDLSNLFYYSLLEVLKKGQLISFSMVQFQSIKKGIIELLSLVLKSLKNLRFLYLDLDEIENKEHFFKEINRICGLIVFVFISNSCVKKSEENLKIFEYNNSLQLIKFHKEISF
jgi:hypothetical protein